MNPKMEDPFANVVATEKELFAFYHIDRVLFYKLVFCLGRDASEAMQAIAFWIWLGIIHRKSSHFSYVIGNYPEHILDAVFGETRIVLMMVENNEFVSFDDTYDIPILQSIMGQQMVNLRFFHQYRLDVLQGVYFFVHHVCLRAFRDFISLVKNYNKSTSRPCNYYQYPDNNTYATATTHTNNFTLFGGSNNVGFGHNPIFNVGDINVPLSDPNHFPSLLEVNGNKNRCGASSSSNYNSNNYDSNISTDDESLIEFFARMQLSENRRKSQEILSPSNERTIFLTFSKGYAIYEPELREFLHRQFGDIIETLQMQEVESEEDQPLFAKLVVRDARAMQLILCGRRKAKFSIDGKHLWARKYVHKKNNNNNVHNNPSSPSSSLSDHQQGDYQGA